MKNILKKFYLVISSGKAKVKTPELLPALNIGYFLLTISGQIKAFIFTG